MKLCVIQYYTEFHKEDTFSKTFNKCSSQKDILLLYSSQKTDAINFKTLH